MKRLFGFLLIAGIAALGLFPACNDAAAPTAGSVSGTVNFQGTWPATGNIQISVFSSFPPAGPPDAFTDPIPPTDRYSFRINGMAPGDYAAVVVGWRHPANPAAAEILGMYWAFVDSVAVDDNGDPRGFPLPVSVEAGELTGDLDMTANLDVAP